MPNFNFPHPPKRVQLEQLRGSDTAGSRGESEKTWTVIETVYLSIATVTGREVVVGRQIDARTTHIMEGHYTATITPQTRIIHGSDIYEVVFSDNVEARGRWMMVQCMRLVT